ncbi:GNAT family N-acetyltransferase [Chungangia koreensis]|uniref:GNAT family N-acetyltransferase n=1 Tax=Chungangia koreensis TaxID=752657 RepID=A0ABV8X3C6_9LACT
MNIRRLAASELPPMELLLDADPSREMVDSYLRKGETFVAEVDNQIIGVYVLMEKQEDSTEIMNIAVANEKQGQGIGRKLIQHAIDYTRNNGFAKLQIGTGNSSIGQLALYQKCGFRIVGIDFDFFLRNYPEPIIENGISCRDMIRMEIILQED